MDTIASTLTGVKDDIKRYNCLLKLLEVNGILKEFANGFQLELNSLKIFIKETVELDTQGPLLQFQATNDNYLGETTLIITGFVLEN